MQFTHVMGGIRNDVPCRYLVNGRRLRCATCDLWRGAPVPVVPVVQPAVPVIMQARTLMTPAEVAEITAMFVKKHQEHLARLRTIPCMVKGDIKDLLKNDVIRVEIGNKHATLVVNADKSVLLVQNFKRERPMKGYPSIYHYLATLTQRHDIHTVSLNSKTSDYNYPH